MSGGALEVSGESISVSELESSQGESYVAPSSMFKCLWAIVSWYGEKPFLGRRLEGGKGAYVYRSYTDVWMEGSRLGAALLHEGLAEFGQFVGICSVNRVEWIVADFACVQYGYTSVPIVVTVEDDVLAFMINQTELRCVVATADQVPKFVRIAPKCPTLRGIVVIDDENVKEEDRQKIPILPWEAAQLIGEQNFPGSYPGEKRGGEDLFTIMYTSGSTGMPKGAMMTDSRWTKFVTNGYMMPVPIRVISFAPLGHVSERQLVWIVAYYGGVVGFYSGDMSRIFDDMQAFNPTYLSAPPRIYNAVYTQYKEAVDAEVAKRGESERWKIELESVDAFRGVFGNAIQFLVTGSAPTSDAVKKFMRLCWAVPVYDGYGTTEAGGIATDDNIGPEVDVRLIDVPELGYLTSDHPPRGEICVKTKHMITGYFKNPEKTAESFVDGYFRTGDIGVLVDGKRVQIIDRIKNVFKLAQGEFVAPAKIEACLEKSRLLDQICVVAAPGNEFVIAVVTPCLETCSRLFDPAPASVDALIDHHAVALEQVMLLDFSHLAKRDGLLSYEVPARVVLSRVKFTPENDLLTPSMKLKRAPIERYFAGQIQDAVERKVSALAEAPAATATTAGPELKRLLSEVLGRPIGDNDDDDDGDATGPGGVSSSLTMQGTDSLSAVKLVSRIRDTLGVEVPLSFVLSNPSVSELNAFVQSGGGSAFKLDLPLAAINDLKTPANVGAAALSSSSSLSFDLAQVNVVLLTGATGFLGSFLLRDLLARLSPQARVVCLVRGVDAQTRLAKALQDRRISVDWNRIEVVVCELADALLGLEADVFSALCSRIDAVFHSAALVNWMLPYETLRSSNVTPCLDLVRLCTTTKVKPLFHISTVTCCPMRRAANTDAHSAFAFEEWEGFADRSWAARLGPYGLSKWVAEEVLRNCGPALPLCILRPANILADSQTGVSNLTDFVHRYVATAIALGVAIGEEAMFNFTPVDWISRAILDIAASPSVLTGTTPFLLTNNASPTYAQLARVLKFKLGFAIEIVSYTEFRAKLISSERVEQLPLYGVLPMFTESSQWIYGHTSDCKNATAIVGVCDVVTEELLQRWLAWLIEMKFIPRP